MAKDKGERWEVIETKELLYGKKGAIIWLDGYGEVAHMNRTQDDYLLKAKEIVALHNTALDINPSNPMAVAEGMGECITALHTAEVRIWNLIRREPEAGPYREMLQGELREITDALAAITKPKEEELTRRIK